MTVSIQDTGLPPGDGFRFAVGSADGLKSSEYRIWSSKNSSDVYIAIVHTAGTMKVSLHESGQWQHSFLSSVAMQYFTANSDRHLEQWNKPEPSFGGWIRAYCITVPRTELRYVDRDNQAVRWADDPGQGYWVNLAWVFHAE